MIKCIEEGKAGNLEFIQAQQTIEESIHKLDLPEVDVFMTEFLPSYKKTLDELK